MPKAYASSQESAPAAALNIKPPLCESPKPSEPLPNSFRSKCGDTLPPLPRTSVSVMAVMDENGYLMQLCTAGDLLRWCKVAWKADLD